MLDLFDIYYHYEIFPALHGKYDYVKVVLFGRTLRYALILHDLIFILYFHTLQSICMSRDYSCNNHAFIIRFHQYG